MTGPRTDHVLAAMAATPDHAREVLAQVLLGLQDCERRAMTCLASHDYTGFGAYASRWSMLARMLPETPASPFRAIVNMAKALQEINKRKREPSND